MNKFTGCNGEIERSLREFLEDHMCEQDLSSDLKRVIICEKITIIREYPIIFILILIIQYLLTILLGNYIQGCFICKL